MKNAINAQTHLHIIHKRHGIEMPMLLVSRRKMEISLRPRDLHKKNTNGKEKKKKKLKYQIPTIDSRKV